MIICHCAVLNDKAIRAAVLAGAYDVDDVYRACGAADRCGGCYEALEALVEVTVRSQAPVAA